MELNRRNVLRRLSIALPLLVSVAIAVTLVVYSEIRANNQRVEEQDNAQRDAQVLASVLTEHVQRSFEQADVLAKLIAERIAHEGFDFDLREMAQKGTISLDVFVQVAATDEKGILRASTVENFKPIDLSDRAHVKVHIDNPAHGPFVSKPLLGRASGKWSIQYSRAILDAAGAFRGVVVISIDPTYFSGFYQQIDIGRQGSITLVGLEDRTVRTRRSGLTYSAGQELPPDSNLFQALKNAPRGHYAGISAIDQHMRYYGYDSLQKYPFSVVVGFEDSEVLAPGNARRASLRWWVVGVAALMMALGAVGTAGIMHVFREADAKSRARDQAKRLAEQLTTVIEAAPDGFLIIDGRMVVSGCNDAFHALSGFGPDEVVGTHLQTLLDRWIGEREFDTQLHVDAMFSALTIETGRQGDIQRIVIARRKPPQQVVELRARRLATGNAGFVLITRDITHETEVDRMKSEFIATAAHELRTPMASIRGFAELLANGKVPEQKRQNMLDIILRQSRRMTELLNDLLDLARIEARSDLDFQYERLDLRELTSAVADEFGYLLNERQLVRDLPGGPVFVRGDRAKLAQAIRNLLGNAFKFSEAPAPVAVRVENDPGAGTALVEVRDLGIGMSPDEQQHLFQRFYRADKSGHIQGSGLGLALVKTIVELHGGRVRIDSLAGVGTSAFIQLPLMPASTDGPGKQAHLQEA